MKSPQELLRLIEARRSDEVVRYDYYVKIRDAYNEIANAMNKLAKAAPDLYVKKAQQILKDAKKDLRVVIMRGPE